MNPNIPSLIVCPEQRRVPSNGLFYWDKIIGTAILAATALALAGCASMVTTTHFTPYFSSETFLGKGGTMRTINGIDIWENGEPNRPYRVIGIIDDSTLESNGAQPGTLDILSVASAVSLGSRDNRLVSEAKKHGADAIVALNLDRSFLGANQYQSNFKQVLKIAAIHYLDSFPKPTFQIGDSRTTIESLVEKTANIPFEAIAKAFKVILSEQEMATCRCSGYVVNGNPMAVLYMSDKAKLIMLIKSAGKFTDAEVTNFLSAFAERSEWNRIPKKKLVDWRRIDGLRWACRFTQTNDVQEWFFVGDQTAIPAE